jgi:putative transposase
MRAEHDAKAAGTTNSGDGAAAAEARRGKVSISKVCRWLGVPRSSAYYLPHRRADKPIDGLIANLIYEIIEAEPTWGVGMVWGHLRFGLGFGSLNRKKVERIMKREGWTCRHRRVGKRPRVEQKKSIAERPDQRWATDIALVHCGSDGWCAMVPVIDCCTRQLVGWELASTARAKTAERALDNALMSRFGYCYGAPAGMALRHDNGLVFGSKQYVATVRAYGLTQEYIAPYTPEQNGLCERFIRTFKQECCWQHRFENIEHARRVIAAWVLRYNSQRPHSALGYTSPDEFYRTIRAAATNVAA